MPTPLRKREKAPKRARPLTPISNQAPTLGTPRSELSIASRPLTTLPNEILLRIIQHITPTKPNCQPHRRGSKHQRLPLMQLYSMTRQAEKDDLLNSTSLICLGLTCHTFSTLVLAHTQKPRLSDILCGSIMKLDSGPDIEPRTRLLALLRNEMKVGEYGMCMCCEDVYVKMKKEQGADERKVKTNPDSMRTEKTKVVVTCRYCEKCSKDLNDDASRYGVCDKLFFKWTGGVVNGWREDGEKKEEKRRKFREKE